MKKLLALTFLLLLLNSNSVFSQDELSEVLADELKRNMLVLKNQDIPSYYMSYRLNDVRTIRLEATFGQITRSTQSHVRRVCVQVRVGDHTLDNTHPIKGENFSLFDMDFGAEMPIENSAEALRQSLWRETNKQYLKAADLYSKVLANVAIKVEDEDASDDFTIESPVVYYEAPIEEQLLDFDAGLWEEKLKRYSALFLENNDVLVGNASIVFAVERKYYVSTEGSSIVENRVTSRLMINGQTQADDGMELPLNNSYFAFYPADLPSDDTIIQETTEMLESLTKLRSAPVVDSYTGPALLSAASAGVFFHEIFGHRIEGHRLKDERDAQTFKKKVGQLVLDKNLSVVFDPSQTKFRDFYLNGAYKYDCQGQPGKRVVVVENGVLKDFLMSRTPIEGFSKSNGHGRAQIGMQAVTRQSNMFVESSNPFSVENLRRQLIDEAVKQGKEYGYYFVETVGGFTTTGRYMPNAFNVTPTMVYRIYVDGRPDELVRGVDLVGTPLSIFSNIEAAGDDYDIFTGMCGAESGSVPVSTVCPTVFVRQIETQRKPKNQDRLPILSRP